VEDRFIPGKDRALLVSRFVGRAQRFDEYLATATNPELVVASLFNVALGNWRSNLTNVTLSLGHPYVDQQRRSAADASLGKKWLVPAS
jgi:hypothetical protein